MLECHICDITWLLYETLRRRLKAYDWNMTEPEGRRVHDALMTGFLKEIYLALTLSREGFKFFSMPSRRLAEVLKEICLGAVKFFSVSAFSEIFDADLTVLLEKKIFACVV